jgi:hypothetical protein
MEVDRAVFYSVTARAWQFVAGPVTLLLVASYFTPQLQGYFYTFASLLALQVFVELSLHVVIVNVSSHEWAKLQLDENGRLIGDQAALGRLVSLGRRVAAWYGIAGLVFVVGVGAAGVVFFWQKALPQHEWLQPWMALVVLTGLLLWTLPFVAILEGCNQVATVNKFRILQAVTGNLVVWAAIALGAGLWTAAASAAVRLLWELYLLCVRYRRFFQPFWSAPEGSPIDWRTEIWPLQWRLAIQGVFHYFAFFLFTPVMLQFHGAAVAGQMGMTWTVLTALQAGAFAWVQTRTPLFGMLIARKDYRELDRVFMRVASISFVVLVAAGTAFCAFVVLINSLGHPLALKLSPRLLPVAPTLALTLAVILQQISKCQNIYIRAHKRDPFLVLSCIVNISAGTLIWLLGKHQGPLGAALGYLGVIALIQVPGWTWIWLRARAEWHATPNAMSPRQD